MFEREPKEPESQSWGYAIFWAGLTFVTVPFVRDGVDLVIEHWGGGFFTYGVMLCAVLALAAALYVTRQKWTIGSFVSLISLAVLVIYLSFDLATGSPVEAVHYVQYGTLSFLLFRAFSHRIRDYSIYAAVTIVGTLAGMIDETIQWLTPDRHFDLRDVWLNFKATALVQIGLAAGIRPSLISGSPGLESVKRICYLGAVTLGYFGLCLQNTPDRVSWYSVVVPGLAWIDPNENIMVEYGHLHGDWSTVYFRSRLTLAEMRDAAAALAEQRAPNFDHYHDREVHEEFWDIYSRFEFPYRYEARIHQLRRDLNLKLAASNDAEDQQVRYLSAAYWENRILKEYFDPFLRGSRYELSAEQEGEVRKRANINKPYESKFSQHLIVGYSSRQLAYLFSCAVLVLVLGGYLCKRASRQKGAP
ncbi:MAG: VanZ family protein [Pseudomonadota bacterium]